MNMDMNIKHIVSREWGNYTVLEDAIGYKVKIININPGKSISKQFHNHRSEHWAIVQGIAQIEIDDEEFFLTPNESIYISIRQVHKCTNPGILQLKFIEVQVGQYTEEDDIIRLDDNKKFGSIL